MLAVRLDSDMERRLNELAGKTHRSKSFYVKQALAEYLDDLEDIFLGRKRLEDLRTGKDELVSFEEVKKDLGL